MNPAMMMQSGQMPSDPFYSLQANYVGVDPKNPSQGPKFHMFGMFRSDGNINAVFMKAWNKFSFKV